MALHAAFRLVLDALMKGINIPGYSFVTTESSFTSFPKKLSSFSHLNFALFRIQSFPFLGKNTLFFTPEIWQKKAKNGLVQIFFLMGIDYQCLENDLFKFFFGQVLDFSKFML